MIPEETITRIRESVNIVELVREHVPLLKKRGRNYQARCPFHQERTPSFSVNPEMGVFKCFGCGVGGDAFKFLMLTEGLSYPDAIRKLGTRVGVTIEEQRNDPATSAETKERQSLYQVLEEAARFYHRHLLESTVAKPARDYLKKRGLTEETLVKFQIGFAPASGQALREAAARKGWSSELLEKAGLLRRKENAQTLFDHFWNRIIFPIWDVQGRIVAFGGRAMGDAMPKYINSPETPVYSKSRHLYGMFQGLPVLRKQRRIVILEGYMDVVVCHQFGFDTSAATLGTALTTEHVRLLRRYVDHVILLFDPDAAGASASLRGGELLMEEGFTVQVVTLPDGLDPDEILLRDGPSTLEAHLKSAVSFIDYSVSQALQRYPPSTPEGKLAAAKEVLPLIAKMPDPLLQDEHLTRLANALNVDKQALGRQLRVDQKAQLRRGSSEAAGTDIKIGQVLSLEEEMLLLALLFPSAPVYELLQGLEWTHEGCRQAWDPLGKQVAEGVVNVSQALSSLPVDVQTWLTSLSLQQRKYPRPVETLQLFLESWRRQREAVRLQSLQPEIDSMLEGRIPMDAKKVQIFNELSRRLKGSVPQPH